MYENIRAPPPPPGTRAISRHYSQRRLIKWVCPPACRNVYPTRTSTSVCFLSSNSSYSLLLFFKRRIHMFRACMCFGHSSFFHPVNLSILGISGAVVSTTPPILFHSGCIPVLLIFLFSPGFFFLKILSWTFFHIRSPVI